MADWGRLAALFGYRMVKERLEAKKMAFFIIKFNELELSTVCHLSRFRASSVTAFGSISFKGGGNRVSSVTESVVFLRKSVTMGCRTGLS